MSAKDWPPPDYERFPNLRRTWRNVLNDFTAGLIATIMYVGFVLGVSMILPERPTFESERGCRIAMFYYKSCG